MTLLIRLLQVYLQSIGKKERPSLAEVFKKDFRVLPTDLDPYLHMNHARYLTYWEALRLGFQIETGFFAAAKQHGWFAPMSRYEVQHLRPLKLFQKFTVTVQVVRIDEKWLYFGHEMYSNDKIVARALIRTTIRSKAGSVPPSVYMPAAGYPNSTIETPEPFREWLERFLNA